MATKTDAKAWIVSSPVEPPKDWGFRPNWWHNRYFRVTTSKLHAYQLLGDLRRLEIENTKMFPWKPSPEIPSLTAVKQRPHLFSSYPPVPGPGHHLAPVPSGKTRPRRKSRDILDRYRRIYFRFWSLPPQSRQDVADLFHLIAPDEQALPPQQRFPRALARARKFGLLDALNAEINRRK
jgi:hypothetical protein